MLLMQKNNRKIMQNTHYTTYCGVNAFHPQILLAYNVNLPSVFVYNEVVF